MSPHRRAYRYPQIFYRGDLSPKREVGSLAISSLRQRCFTSDKGDIIFDSAA
jgi:hypothetical protein